MIHVNVRGLIIRELKDQVELMIQLRKREGEPELYELPGGRINEYEKITDALKREVLEETGLKVVSIQNEENIVITSAAENKVSFSVESIKPFAAYQTLEGPVLMFLRDGI